MGKITYNISAKDRRALAPYFDEAYYISAYPDVAASNIEPLSHYCMSGWREGRNPSHSFNTIYYLRRHSDVAEAGLNPLLHFAYAGEREGRATHRPIDAWRRRLKDYVSPPPVEAAPSRPETAKQVDYHELLQALTNGSANGPLIVSVSHDDYANNIGGVQNLIADEQKASSELGWRYLHIYPIRREITLAPTSVEEGFPIGIRLGYDSLGQVGAGTLIEVLSSLFLDGTQIEIVIHHMMGHAPELLLRMIRASGNGTPTVWAHDFFTICPSYALLRNDVVFCGGPPQSSPACTICSYGTTREDHSRRMRLFFEETCPNILAPSKVALEDWKRMANYRYSAANAVSLGRLLLASSAVQWPAGESGRPLRIAHVGARDFHKGWPAFEELAVNLCTDRRYTFFQLGRADGEPIPGCIRQVPVRVTRDTRDAMVEAIAENNIDVVVSFSFWPETFCFAAHEAVAGGAFVITHLNAGNVPRMLMDGTADHGMVLEDRNQLLPLFMGNDLTRCLANSRRHRGAIVLSSGTIGWLEDEMTSRRFALERGRARA